MGHPKEIEPGELKAYKAGNDIKLKWEASCGPADNYTIYEGTLNSLKSWIYDHYSIICNDIYNDLNETFTPSGKDTYNKKK